MATSSHSWFNKKAVADLSLYLKVHKDGTVERLFGSQYAPPLLRDPVTRVSSKDIKISESVSVRIYLPPLKTQNEKLPVLVYYHGGGFCLESAFSAVTHRYVNHLALKANAITISVEYRRAPENPLPAAFDDSWAALRWVASHVLEQAPVVSVQKVRGLWNMGFRAVKNNLSSLAPSQFAPPQSEWPNPKEPWLVSHGDFRKLFVGGDNSGATIAHDMAWKAGFNDGRPNIGLAGGVKILGTILCFPYFCDENTKKDSMAYKLWMFGFPKCANGIRDKLINPFGPHDDWFTIQSKKMFVCYGEKDHELRDVSKRFVNLMQRMNAWGGEVKAFEVNEEGCFQVDDPTSKKAKSLILEIASFIIG